MKVHTSDCAVHVVHNDTGGDSIHCACGASTVTMTFPISPVKETVSVKKAPPAPPKKRAKKNANR